MEDIESMTPLGIATELSNNVLLDDFDLEDSHEPDFENFELSSDGARHAPLCHLIHPHMQEIAKHEHHFPNEAMTQTHSALTRSL